MTSGCSGNHKVGNVEITSLPLFVGIVSELQQFFLIFFRHCTGVSCCSFAASRCTIWSAWGACNPAKPGKALVSMLIFWMIDFLDGFHKVSLICITALPHIKGG